MAADLMRVSESDLRECCLQALRNVGVPDEHAELVVYVMVTADLQGIETHGVRRLIPYLIRIREGLINATPEIRVRTLAPAVRLVHGDNGLGPVVAMTGLNAAMDAAAENGIGLASCTASNHLGAGAPYALAACKRGLMLLGGSNAFATMPPTRGREPLVGNNPVYIGMPRREGPHFILDVALSVVARGKLRVAAERGESVPKEWAFDPEGRPTTDPLIGLKGSVPPIGAHKGYGMALAVDVLAGVLAGGAFGTAVMSMFQGGKARQDTGHFFVVLDPSVFMDEDALEARCEELFREVKAATPLDPALPVIYPGEPEAASMARCQAEGVPMDRAKWKTLQAFARGDFDADVPKL